MTNDPTQPDDDRTLLDALSALPPVDAPADLHARFRDRLAREGAIPLAPHGHQAQRTLRAPPLWVRVAIAASLVLVAGGSWWIDHQQHERDARELRAELATALQALSAAARLQGITVAGNAGVRDDGIVAALTQALLTDPNTNVRVAAAEALARLADRSALAAAATRALGKEASPFVQAALMAATARLMPDDRSRVLREMLSRTDLDSLIRAEAEVRSRS